MLNNNNPITSFPVGAADVRQQMTARGGGAWIKGNLYLFLSPAVRQSIDILDLVPQISPPSHSKPDWIYYPEGGCGGSADRIFDLDLDHATLTDRGVNQGSDGSPMSDSQGNVPTEPLGSTFTVDPTNHVIVKIQALSCRANYSWRLEIKYALHGSATVQTASVGPFLSIGETGNAPVYDNESPDGQNWQFVRYNTSGQVNLGQCDGA
jgi:hypothetical protein